MSVTITNWPCFIGLVMCGLLVLATLQVRYILWRRSMEREREKYMAWWRSISPGRPRPPGA